ncbi:MAG: NfeD family protein [Acidimicrobiia bacterium]|nr:NfeD family protein [Acidimicrobiia bacterium]
MSERLTIKQIIADCERYWLDTKVPRSRVREMATELESHLLEAAAEDKSPEAVVGPDLAQFAEAWASEYRGPTSLEAWNNTGDPAAHRADLLSAYGWLIILAVAVPLLIMFGPKENNVDDVEVWRWIWVVGAAALGIGEMLTAGFFLLPFAIGSVAAAILAFAGVAVPVQVGVFVGASILALWGIQRFAWREREEVHALGAKRYVDARATVTETINRLDGTGRVRLDTEQWRATTLLDEDITPGTEVRVVDVTGARLVVEPLE